MLQAESRGYIRLNESGRFLEKPGCTKTDKELSFLCKASLSNQGKSFNIWSFSSLS